MTAQEVIDEVVRKLKENGVEKIRSRRKRVATLADVRERWPGLPTLLKTREHAIFSTDQGYMKAAGRTFKLKVVVSGHHVADLEFTSKATAPMFVANQAVAARQLRPTAAKRIEVPQEPLRWSKDADDGATIRRFLKDCDDKLPVASAELLIQHQLVRALCGTKKDVPALANLRPVMPFGFPTEIATVVDRQGEPASGNMDILARTVQGRRGAGGHFVVMELKGPQLTGRGTGVRDALHQAIGYAAALASEANWCGSIARDGGPLAYRRLFAPPRTAGEPAPKYSPTEPIVVHAVVVLPSSCKAQTAVELSTLELEGCAMSIGALYYDAVQDERQKWMLQRLEWSKQPGAWRP